MSTGDEISTQRRDPNEKVVVVERVQFEGAAGALSSDEVAREEPLSIRLGAASLGIVMRTPGNDRELALGLLLTERLIPSAAAVRSIRHRAPRASDEAGDNFIHIVLNPDVDVDASRLRRFRASMSSCGVCGRASIDTVLEGIPALEHGPELDVQALYRLPERLRGAQDVFSRTGGLHAAGLFTAEGECLVVREDIGRHNAVDKVVGWLAEHGSLAPADRVLMVSGRISFEIAQKAIAARLPVVAAVSAPSSLAVELGRRANLTIVGFLRGERACVYSGARRIRGAP